jgi:hypothetical protein
MLIDAFCWMLAAVCCAMIWRTEPIIAAMKLETPRRIRAAFVALAGGALFLLAAVCFGTVRQVWLLSLMVLAPTEQVILLAGISLMLIGLMLLVVFDRRRIV